MIFCRENRRIFEWARLKQIILAIILYSDWRNCKIRDPSGSKTPIIWCVRVRRINNIYPNSCILFPYVPNERHAKLAEILFQLCNELRGNIQKIDVETSFLVPNKSRRWFRHSRIRFFEIFFFEIKNSFRMYVRKYIAVRTNKWL